MRYEGNLVFDGPEYDHKRDSPRLSKQLNRIFELMKDGKYRTLNQISEITGDPHASVSSALRCFRKPKFGSYIVDKQYIGNGLYEYRLDIHSTNEDTEL